MRCREATAPQPLPHPVGRQTLVCNMTFAQNFEGHVLTRALESGSAGRGRLRVAPGWQQRPHCGSCTPSMVAPLCASAPSSSKGCQVWDLTLEPCSVL